MDSCCTPPVLFLFLLLFLLLRSTRIELCTTPCTRWCHPWEHSASAVCSGAVVLILSLSLPPSLPPSFPPSSPFLTHTLLFTPPLPSLSFCFLPLSHSPTTLLLPLFLWLCFFPSGVQMTLLVIAVKPTLWPVSTVCQFPLLSLCQTVFVPCVHAGCREIAFISCYYLIV